MMQALRWSRQENIRLPHMEKENPNPNFLMARIGVSTKPTTVLPKPYNIQVDDCAAGGMFPRR